MRGARSGRPSCQRPPLAPGFRRHLRGIAPVGPPVGSALASYRREVFCRFRVQPCGRAGPPASSACRFPPRLRRSGGPSPSTLGARGGKRVSLRCGRGRRPRLRGKLRRCGALPVAAFSGLTRWLRCQSFLSCGHIGGRACGGVPLAGFWPGGSLLFRSAVATLLTIRPTRRSKGRCAIKPRSAPELPRWALTL